MPLIQIYAEVENFISKVQGGKLARKHLKRDENMTTQMAFAREGKTTKEMKIVAKKEKVSEDFILKKVGKGQVVIPANINHKNLEPVGIGRGLRIKINSNIGTSPEDIDLKKELKKLEISIQYGADTVMDLSTGGDLDHIRTEILRRSTVPVGTVPIYQTMAEAKTVDEVTAKKIFEVIKKQAEQGVDFMTLHCGVTREAIPLLKNRIAGVVSRGGSFLVAWMRRHEEQNPLYEGFEEVLEICKKYDVTISLGDGLRPGCLSDATDKAQLHELKILGELTKRAWAEDVQVMVEGPGHVPFNQIKKNMELQQRYCHGAPFYVLGPLVTDISAGYDHITGAIGGTLAAFYGASFLCYVTPAEHLKLPDVEDVKEGVIASKIAAHSADIALGIPGAIEKDNEISLARRKLDWEKQISLSVDPEKARRYREKSKAKDDQCTMCGKYCALKLFDDKVDY